MWVTSKGPFETWQAQNASTAGVGGGECRTLTRPWWRWEGSILWPLTFVSLSKRQSGTRHFDGDTQDCQSMATPEQA